VLVALFAALAFAGGWVPASQSASHGDVSVRVSYDQQSVDPAGDVKIYRRLRVRVTRGTTVVLDRQVCAQVCGPAPGGAIAFRNVWGTREPEVIVSLYTGGAHCCFENELVLLRGKSPATAIFHDWGDLGYRGQWLHGRFWFVTGDDRFAYAFTSFAASAFPMQVWSIDGAGRLVDVTRRRPDLVAANAKRLWKTYLADRKRNDIRGVIGPWCADEYLLGKGPLCEVDLDAALSSGYLRADGIGPAGRAYIAALHGDLARWGYTRA
jgi:hypothetical protein